MPQSKISKIINALSPDHTSVDFAEFDSQVGILKDKLKEKVQAKTLEDVNVQLDKFRKRINIEPLVEAVKNIESSINDKYDSLAEQVDSQIIDIETLISKTDSTSKVKDLETELADLKEELSSLEKVRKQDIESVYKNIPNVSDIEDRVDEMLVTLSSRIDALDEEEIAEVEDWQIKIDALRREIINRIGQIGGGNMNRQIFIGGANPLTRFTDINFKAGSNVTITYQDNAATQKVDVTISSSGGGGGSTRNIQTIAISQTAGSASGTDYVYLCSGTLTLTMPTTVANNNLYTVKNIGAGIVTINTTGGETIDGQLTQIMPIQFTSVDLISNNSGDWAIT